MEYLSLSIGVLLALCHGGQVASVVVSHDIGHLCNTHPTITLAGQTTLLNITTATMTFPHGCNIMVKLPSIDTELYFWIEPEGTIIPCDWITATFWNAINKVYYTHDACWVRTDSERQFRLMGGVSNITLSVHHNGSTVNMITPEVNVITAGATPTAPGATPTAPGVTPTAPGATTPATGVTLVLSRFNLPCFDPTETCHDADTCRGKAWTDCGEVFENCPFLCGVCFGKVKCNCDTARKDYKLCNNISERCVHPDMVCDGYRNCFGGEDEGRLCEEKMEAERRAKEKAREMASAGGGRWGGGMVNRWWWVVVSVGVWVRWRG